MSLIAILTITTVLLTALSLLYVKHDSKPINPDYPIAVLSGKTETITKNRLKQARNLVKKSNYKESLYLCGKEMGPFMARFLKQAGLKNQLQVVDSVDTLKDAKLLKEIVGNPKTIVLITSLSHQRRAFHTFQKVFRKTEIINKPTWYEIFSWYSPLMPTGWLATTINFIKDIKYRSNSVLSS